jgi:hypothetical protein
VVIGGYRIDFNTPAMKLTILRATQVREKQKQKEQKQKDSAPFEAQGKESRRTLSLPEWQPATADQSVESVLAIGSEDVGGDGLKALAYSDASSALPGYCSVSSRSNLCASAS